MLATDEELKELGLDTRDDLILSPTQTPMEQLKQALRNLEKAPTPLSDVEKCSTGQS